MTSPSRGRDDVALVDLVDRLLEQGVVLSGDVTLSVADVDLVYLSLNVLLGSVETVHRLQARAMGVGAVALTDPEQPPER